MIQSVSNDIVLLGNGPIASDQRNWVDQCAFVIRFNIPRNGGAQNGGRCDALCVTNHGMPARRFAKYRKLQNHPFIYPATEIWIPRPSWHSSISCFLNHPIPRIRWQQDHSSHLIRRNGLQNHTQVYFSEQIWKQSIAQLNLDANEWQISPSTGFLTLTYCLQRFPLERFRIHLLGFSFKGSDAHPWSLERQVVERMSANGEVLWEMPSVGEKRFVPMLQNSG